MDNHSVSASGNSFLHQLLSGNRQMCLTISKKYLSQNPSIKDLYEEVFKKALYDVGRLWETNKITVATEHLATAITEGILNELYSELVVAEPKNNKVVLTCVENELHQVGIKMVADVFEMNGWESYFLGTGIPLKELVKYVNEMQPAVMAISFSIYFNYKNLLHMIALLKAEFPELKIIVGGQALSHIAQANIKKINNVEYVSNLYVLDEYVKSFNTLNHD